MSETGRKPSYRQPQAERSHLTLSPQGTACLGSHVPRGEPAFLLLIPQWLASIQPMKNTCSASPERHEHWATHRKLCSPPNPSGDQSNQGYPEEHRGKVPLGGYSLNPSHLWPRPFLTTAWVPFSTVLSTAHWGIAVNMFVRLEASYCICPALGHKGMPLLPSPEAEVPKEWLPLTPHCQGTYLWMAHAGEGCGVP